MNEDIEAGPECYRLIKHWEKGPVEVNGVPWPRTPDGAALKAYQCSAGKWTISFGVRWHPGGRPVKMGDTITPDQVMPYLEAAMGRVVADVRRVVTSELNQYQMDAVVVWVYNLGIGALKNSTELLPAINSGRWHDAAAEMGVFIYATTTANDGRLWKRAMKGLLVRRYSEATLALGYDPSAAYTYDISLPTEREWQPDWVNPETGKKQGRYFDRVLAGKTKFKDVLRTAQKYPLPELEQIKPDPIVTVITDVPRPHVTDVLDVSTPNTVPLEVESLQLPEDELLLESVASPDGSTVVTDSAPAKTDVASGSEAVRSAPPPVAPASVETRVEPGPPPPKPPIIIAPKQIDPNTADYGAVDIQKGAKNMTDSRRFVGLLIVGLGSLIQVLAARNVVTSLFGAIFFDLSRDPVVLALMAGAVVWFIGLFTKKRGGKVMTTGFVHAEQLLK